MNSPTCEWTDSADVGDRPAELAECAQDTVTLRGGSVIGMRFGMDDDGGLDTALPANLFKRP